MPVYVINNMRIHDRAEYDAYVRDFLGVFRQFEGKVLAAQDTPPPFEGEWPFDRTVLLSFPDREQMRRWYESPAYQAIVGHRFKGTTSNVVVLDGLPQIA